tara:strand:- start:539 stop:703 length:165 start_codon:yes stop_codon:yes gene_type:complete
MSYFTITSFFVAGIIVGLVIGYILNRKEYLTQSRKSLEKAIVESGIANKIIDNV